MLGKGIEDESSVISHPNYLNTGVSPKFKSWLGTLGALDCFNGVLECCIRVFNSFPISICRVHLWLKIFSFQVAIFVNNFSYGI